MNFLQRHDFDLVCRAHMVVEDGYEFYQDRILVTVFSAPNVSSSDPSFLELGNRDSWILHGVIADIWIFFAVLRRVRQLGCYHVSLWRAPLQFRALEAFGFDRPEESHQEGPQQAKQHAEQSCKTPNPPLHFLAFSFASPMAWWKDAESPIFICVGTSFNN
jgi:hypothetical protein